MAKDGRHMLREARLACGMVMALGLVTALCVAGPAGAQAGGESPAAPSICRPARHPPLAARLSTDILSALSRRSSAVRLTLHRRATAVSRQLHDNCHIHSASVGK